MSRVGSWDRDCGWRVGGWRGCGSGGAFYGLRLLCNRIQFKLISFSCLGGFQRMRRKNQGARGATAERGKLTILRQLDAMQNA